jgi:hypothetical protein
MDNVCLLAIVFVVIVFILLFFVTTKGRSEFFEVGKNNEYRLLYYTDDADFFLPRVHSLHKLHETHASEFPKEFLEKYYALHFETCEALFKNRTKSLPFPASYVENLYAAWASLDKKYKTRERVVVWYPRDRVERFNFPVIVKSRIMATMESTVTGGDADGHGSILMKLNSIRHYDRMEAVVKKRPKEPLFRDKIPQLVWRGAPTGYGFGNNIPFRTVSRETLLKKHVGSLSPFINVGLVVKKPAHETWKKYHKEEMSLDELLKYKYLLSVEGNDVATNLKWVLASNSLVVMPEPQVSSWLMEDALRPYVHYLPVRDDFSNLEKQIEWAERNPKKCEKMIVNAHRYVEPFLDETKEQTLQTAVLKYYLDNFQWIA